MQRLLFATDLSESCNSALEFVADFVKDRDFIIDIIHVYNIPVTLVGTLDAHSVSELLEKKESNAKEVISNQVKTIPMEQRGAVYLKYGIHPSSEIVALSAEIKSDMIVMALRKKYKLIDKLFGSVTSQTISKSELPVLAIPNGVKYQGLNQILFPTKLNSSNELTENEEEALYFLNNFCCLENYPTIQMVHIRENSGLDIEYLNRPFPKMKFVVTHAPSLHDGMAKLIEKKKIDLIAFYKSNKSFWESLSHSSLTHQLLFDTRIPLLIFS